MTADAVGKQQPKSQSRGGGGEGGKTLEVREQGRQWLMLEWKTCVLTGHSDEELGDGYPQRQAVGRTIKKERMRGRDRDVTSREGC